MQFIVPGFSTNERVYLFITYTVSQKNWGTHIVPHSSHKNRAV